ncbi:MAG: Cys-tRNA(Pro) deacylase [Bacteroidaceae bacterium]|jgi:Cys-tRNA(Pro)/Cys-tRNA(Cys) deacylase
MKLKKTNAARLLDQAGIKYELVPYEVHEEDLSAASVANSLREDLAQVFKTIVMTGDKVKFFVCVVPGAKEVDLKAAAKISGNKKCESLHLKLLLPTTGYIRGGCSPIGMKKLFPTFIDASAQQFPFIFVSAGQRGLQLKISPQDLASISEAIFADIATD